MEIHVGGGGEKIIQRMRKYLRFGIESLTYVWG
jgi:hypothetical protein